MLGLLCAQGDILQARLCQALGRSLYIDEATAQFYLEDAGGDMKTAMEAFGECAHAATSNDQQNPASSATCLRQNNVWRGTSQVKCWDARKRGAC